MPNARPRLLKAPTHDPTNKIGGKRSAAIKCVHSFSLGSIP